ncbi:hypothetical protein Tco_1492066 [Tanacetum coccineum]
MDSIIPIGQKNTLAEYMILFGADNRPPMYIYNYSTTTLHFGKRSLPHGHQLIHYLQYTSNVGKVFSISHFSLSTSGLVILTSTHLRNLYIFKRISSQCRYWVYTLGSSNPPLPTSIPTTLGLDTSS